MQPTFVIIGAQKSASTFLQMCLREHPEIYMPEKETVYFESPEYEQLGANWLNSIFRNRKEKHIGIKRPNCIGRAEVPSRIKEVLPDAKLIAVLRNPVERAVSAYFHQMNSGVIPIEDINIAMREIINGDYQKKHKRAEEIIEFGYYYKYLKLYDYYLKNNKLLILLHEDIVKDASGSIEKVYEFLDVKKNYLPKSLKKKPQAVIYNYKRLKFLTIRNKYRYRYNSDFTRVYLKEKNFFECVIDIAITGFDRYILSEMVENNKPDLEYDLKLKLFKMYEHDIELLKGLLKKDFSCWKPIKDR